MATKIFPSRPAGRKTKIRRKQAAAAASAPPSPPPAQRPLPQLPRWTLPFLWMSTMVDSAVALLPELVRSLTLGLPSRTPSQAARLNYVEMARKWEEDQDRRAQGGMAWMYSWEYMAGSKLLGRRGIRRSPFKNAKFDLLVEQTNRFHVTNRGCH